MKYDAQYTEAHRVLWSSLC